MNQNRSVATIDAPEFINIQPYNPLISQCEIKVLYLGKNRNHSYIDKNTAIQMANSLPGTPIVGAFREEIEDFGDHGHVMRIEDGEVHFSCKTRPYGFVAPDAKVWFKKFIETDDLGNDIVREYLMTNGYLWTSQYKEAMECISEGKGQSMELDSDSLNGHWASSDKSGVEFFIINDAVFSKLCILGDDVEPCFEGAAVTSPEISAKFTQDTDFQRTLFTMMNELKDALQNKGGSDMPVEVTSQDNEEIVEETIDEVETDSTEVDVEEDSAAGETDFTQVEYSDEGGEDSGEGETETEETAEDEVETPDENISTQSDSVEMPSEEVKFNDDDDDEKKKKSDSFSLEEFQALQEAYANLETECNALREFKLGIENEKKDALIAKYFMLDDDDKADIVEHKTEYSYEEIESKLALLYVQKNVDFTSLTDEIEDKEEESVATTFSLDEDVSGFVPDFLEALRQTKER